MSDRDVLLRQVMHETRTTQSELSRLSGVHQPSISHFLAGKIDMSDEKVDRLLSCMGYRLEIVRRLTVPDLTRSERRSWQLHRQLSLHLDRSMLDEKHTVIRKNLKRLDRGVQGQPHERNLKRWKSLLDSGDLAGLRRILTGLDRDSIEMREVSPLGGLLSADDRVEALRKVS